MALTVVATAKAVNANSYVTLADAESRIEERLHVSDWEGAIDATKNAALVWATRILDEQFNWAGYKTTAAQNLRWPRIGIYNEEDESVDEDTIPTFLARATIELALYLIGEDRTNTETGLEGFDSIQVESIRLQTNKVSGKTRIPDAVIQIIKHYGVPYTRPGQARLVRA